jgi:hypothetical protein
MFVAGAIKRLTMATRYPVAYRPVSGSPARAPRWAVPALAAYLVDRSDRHYLRRLDPGAFTEVSKACDRFLIWTTTALFGSGCRPNPPAGSTNCYRIVGNRRPDSRHRTADVRQGDCSQETVLKPSRFTPRRVSVRPRSRARRRDALGLRCCADAAALRIAAAPWSTNASPRVSMK